MPLVYPVYPKAKKQLQVFGLDTSGLTFVDPLDYLGFLLLEHLAMLVLSDSGGVHEEVCVLGVPCVSCGIILRVLRLWMCVLLF